MIRVAVETATALGSVAVARDDRVLAEVGVGVQSRHAEKVLPALEAALALAGVKRTAIGEVVVGAGPGSFTGVRVAGATAKGLATALDVPLVAYSTLLVVAAGVPWDGPVCALLDARRGECYGGAWRVDAERLETLVAPSVDRAEAFAGVGDALYAGDGAVKYAGALRAAGARVGTAPAPPRASTLLWLAARHRVAGEVADGSAWEPAYVRASSAERGVRG